MGNDAMQQISNNIAGTNDWEYVGWLVSDVVLTGGLGDDTLNGGAGDDTIILKSNDTCEAQICLPITSHPLSKLVQKKASNWRVDNGTLWGCYRWRG